MSAAAARAKVGPLTREEAIEILNRLPVLVASSGAKLLSSQYSAKARDYMRRHEQTRRFEKPLVVHMEFAVFDGPHRHYVFETQPFQVLAAITIQEFRKAAPFAATGRFHYIISTD